MLRRLPRRIKYAILSVYIRGYLAYIEYTENKERKKEAKSIGKEGR